MENNAKTPVLTDESLMPFGIHKDKTLETIPASYFIWLFDNDKMGTNNGIKEYIEDNMDVFKKEIKESNKYSR